jgi:hypothetical protein
MPQLTRLETISLLASLGVDVPAHSKLPDASLNQRLSKALNAAQRLHAAVPNGVIDPSTIPAWDSHREPAGEAVKRVNIQEAAANMAARAQGRQNFVEMGENACMDGRQTLMALGRMYDVGMSGALMQDKAESRGMIMRVRGVPPLCLAWAKEGTYARFSLFTSLMRRHLSSFSSITHKPARVQLQSRGRGCASTKS